MQNCTCTLYDCTMTETLYPDSPREPEPKRRRTRGPAFGPKLILCGRCGMHSVRRTAGERCRCERALR